ncbi:cAMP-binding domain of CRP or a regulatory subunit of cAMP-dependent protein kinases [Nostoc flagelliforme CCNUN1]|uniref:cAMP-binding domain of CRP or a regulatory subunit of cAMP-dependent protein kinases n=1 Tax=Nostoc flagelliforme CCNUN1 TaxID=2038116 RepID=A0A2K8SXH3_9NOSO|nr:Crp/Fnr family transcriptional regulator [Nostoc flagelliforme]AUB40149.1 cAMP-binding domain of CRP or a regulatory subunit of cAMP-dependent protein kinases [Nostoc flagelliforme CCNUN1]
MSLDKSLFQQRPNKLLAALPASDYERLVPHLKLVPLPVGQILYRAAEPITHAYFPDKAVVSIVTTMEDGSTAEVGIVSNEGMVGIPVILGENTTTTTSFVQIAGAGMQINADILRAEFNRGGAIQILLLRYVQAIYSELAQGAACNRLHTLEERLARWLLTVSDRLESEDFPLTHEFISQMLGVRRSGVTVAASILSRAGMIRYQRGHITILNREDLEATSCECHQVIQKEFARLLGFMPSNRARKFF